MALTIKDTRLGLDWPNLGVREAVELNWPLVAAAMFLTAKDGGVEATNGITLGGGTITNNASWVGKWILLEASREGCVLTVAAASAAIVRISR